MVIIIKTLCLFDYCIEKTFPACAVFLIITITYYTQKISKIRYKIFSQKKQKWTSPKKEGRSNDFEETR